MQFAQKRWSEAEGWSSVGDQNATEFDLVLAFGSRHILEKEGVLSSIKSELSTPNLVLGSTSGEILDTNVSDETIVATGIKFDSTKVEIHRVNISDFADSREAGNALTNKLEKNGLRHVFVLSDGGSVNGTALIEGLEQNLNGVTVTGGLAGDAARFEKTVVGYNEDPHPGEIVTIGLYGEALKVGYASVGGWDTFGPVRKITKSDANKLYELDGSSALDLYKEYLGDKAEGLPGTALLFPLSIKVEGTEEHLVRTILNIDEETGAMIFAGDMPEGAEARLMKANFDKLIDGAYDAAQLSMNSLKEASPELAILVSCVGRKLVLDQRIEEEVEEVRQMVGPNTKLTGFYSYGELAPFSGFTTCSLHNQTMTITLLSEA